MSKRVDYFVLKVSFSSKNIKNIIYYVMKRLMYKFISKFNTCYKDAVAKIYF